MDSDLNMYMNQIFANGSSRTASGCLVRALLANIIRCIQNP
jgi:hypothetical protein